MSPFTRRLTAFLLCIAIGSLLSVILTKVVGPGMTIPAIRLVQRPQIQEITMEVSNGWCSGETCRDYKIIFHRQGHEDYYSSVTWVGLWSREVKTGSIARLDFDHLADVFESQLFFDFESAYPGNTWCTDCLITRVSVLQDGRRKNVVSLNDDMPLQLWTIHRAVEGVATHVQWLND